ncbi:MAG TPA: GNAT family N-acetyltransferase [Aggregatilinea sp.]|uniref:GNAT family N-acetyltransferase n=1 Tax=Aggregatilinea sp. TaxID=2806333 RepID=UPI002B743000|nr:GNAT family N-acetyltransferase [Aggregatilinea sp.]HML20477.1 GNAT family N-acetyltransferase [Aggregatilinea sp.]
MRTSQISEHVIRPVQVQDEAAIARLWQALSDYHVRLDPRMPIPAQGAAGRYAARLVESRDDPKTCTLVAEVDGEAVGFALGAIITLHPDLFVPVESGYIADVYVDRRFRRRGLARDLVTALTEWFHANGAAHIEWQVAAANSAGIRFWEAMGGLATMVRMRMEPEDGDSR